MSKKSKRRKSRRLSSSSSSEDEKTSTNKTGSTKRKRCWTDELNDVKVQKTKDDTRSSKDEQRKREIKKPVYRLEKAKSTRGDSPIFKDETKSSKIYESKSSKYSSVKKYLQDKQTLKSNAFKSSEDRSTKTYSQDKPPTAERDISKSSKDRFTKTHSQDKPPTPKKDVSKSSEDRFTKTHSLDKPTTSKKDAFKSSKDRSTKTHSQDKPPTPKRDVSKSSEDRFTKTHSQDKPTTPKRDVSKSSEDRFTKTHSQDKPTTPKRDVSKSSKDRSTKTYSQDKPPTAERDVSKSSEDRFTKTHSQDMPTTPKKDVSKSSIDRSTITNVQDEPSTPKRDIFIPRLISITQKLTDQNKLTRKTRWDVPVKTIENPLLVPKDATGTKTTKLSAHNQPSHEHLKTELQSHTPAVTALMDAETNLKTSQTLVTKQSKILKEGSVLPERLPIKFVVKNQTVSQLARAEDAERQDSKNRISYFRNSFLPVCQADSSTSQRPEVLSNLASKPRIVDQGKPVSIQSDNNTPHKEPALCKMASNTICKRKTSRKKMAMVLPAQQRKILNQSNVVRPLSNFKIPKMTTSGGNYATSTIESEQSTSSMPSVITQSQPSSSTTISPYQILPNLDSWTSSETAPSSSSYDQMQVVEELQQARSERLLRVDVMQTCGELTSMEIDPPDYRATDTECTGRSQQDVILVLDTNILLSHLTYVKDIVTCGLKDVGLPVVLIPWVVLQELDCLKKKQGLAQRAVKAISYINTSLKNRERRVWGQSIQQATESSLSSNAPKTENNDDRVLRCCLQYQRLYQGVAVVLCTDDKNLCSKALLSGVKAFSKEDLESELTSSSPCSSAPQNPQTSTSTAKAYHSQEVTSHSLEKERERQSKNIETQRHLSSLVHELKSCLQMALSDVLETEMKAAFSDMWLEIVYRKPPWSLDDVLHCMKKHWIAVFGHVITRNKQHNVLNLIEFFSSGKSVTNNSMLAALHESQDLLNEFATKSSHVAGAICVVKNILNSLQTQGESSADDIVMKEAEEDKQVAPSPCKVWTHFTNIWDHVYKSSLRVFEALGFDPLASVSVPLGRPPPPQDVLLCLDHLRSTVTQMLQAFGSFLTSPDLEEAQSLLSLLQSTPAVKADNVTAADILDCFSQQEYRERLGMGGNQLMEMKSALERCLELNTVPQL